MKVKHPWTNDQVERINRTIKDVTIKSFTYKTGTMDNTLL